MSNDKIINISRKTFVSVILILSTLILFAIGLTYIIPNGAFKEVVDANGNVIFDYSQYYEIDDVKGIPIWKGLLSPILVLFSGDGLSLIMLSIFICVIAGSFQIMSDTNGMKYIVQKLISKFKYNKNILIALITLIFMIFGSFFGLFEEVLTLLPIIIILSLSLGYDSYLGFIMCVVATGFGFASAITNPFTVLTASNIIGVSPMTNIWYRIIIFMVMYGVLLIYIFRHIKKLKLNPEKSPTYSVDIEKKNGLVFDENIDNRKCLIYSVFLITVFLSIIILTSIESLRGYTIVFLIVIFLIGGIIAGLLCEPDKKKVFKSFLKGFLSGLPAVVLILLASSIKYILEEGMVIATVANSISNLVAGKNTFVVILLLFLIILVLEFFISSSTAKAVFVMGILGCISINVSKELMVLAYLFGDGYTNVLFPTSPVLLIGLSMTGMNYTTWLKKSKFLFLITFVLVIAFLLLAIVIKY